MALPDAPSAPGPSKTSTKKRKAHDANDSVHDQIASSSTSTSQAVPIEGPISLLTEGEEEVSADEDVVDELYCTLRSTVVGVQYYNGERLTLSCPLAFSPRVRIGGGGRASQTSSRTEQSLRQVESFHFRALVPHSPLSQECNSSHEHRKYSSRPSSTSDSWQASSPP
jgi:hypothetical protein